MLHSHPHSFLSRDTAGRALPGAWRMRGERGVLQSYGRSVPVPAGLLPPGQRVPGPQKALGALRRQQRVCAQRQLHARLRRPRVRL